MERFGGVQTMTTATKADRVRTINTANIKSRSRAGPIGNPLSLADTMPTMIAIPITSTVIKAPGNGKLRFILVSHMRSNS